MKKKAKEVSKGNFMDFCEEISKNKRLRKKFLDELYKVGEKADDLLDFFHSEGYDGVSLEDCEKLLFVAAQGPLPGQDELAAVVKY